MIWLVRLWLAIVSIRSSMVNGGLETQWIYTLYYTRFASQLEQIYVNFSIRLLIICKRQLANLWQTFMADHHFCPAPVRTTIAIARLYLKIVRPFGRKWMRGGYSVIYSPAICMRCLVFTRFSPCNVCAYSLRFVCWWSRRYAWFHHCKFNNMHICLYFKVMSWYDDKQQLIYSIQIYY